jgi:hypothetical protein
MSIIVRTKLTFIALCAFFAVPLTKKWFFNLKGKVKTACISMQVSFVLYKKEEINKKNKI